MRQDTIDRFWAKVDKLGTAEHPYCWEWKAYRVAGYGHFRVDGTTAMAHRLSYKILLEDPGEMCLDHVCRNKAGVNPAHLEPVTVAENTRRSGSTARARSAANKSKRERLRCLNGHEFTDGNTYIRAGGARRCRTCQALATHRWRLKGAT